MAKAGHERQRLFPQHFWVSENRVQKERHSRNYFHKEFQVERVINRQEKMMESSDRFPSVCFGFYGADGEC